MNNTKSTSLFTKDLFDVQRAIESGNKKKFMEVYNEVRSRMSNCSCGDSYLQQAYLKICYQAIEKFILV